MLNRMIHWKQTPGAPRKHERAQTMVEFALVFPLVLLIIFGIVEFGRVMFLYAQVVTASREGARYGTASGDFIQAIPHYQDCAGIRDAVRRSAILVDIPDSSISISYDRRDPTTNTFQVISPTCPPPNTIRLGDRVIVTAQADFEPLLGLINIPPFTLQSVTRRTILKAIDMGVGGASGGSSAPPEVRFTADRTLGATETITGTNAVLVQVEMNNAATVDVQVPFSVAGTATGADFSVSASPVVIPAGSKTAFITVYILDDDIYEPAPFEYVVLILGQPSYGTLITPNSHTIFIGDDDHEPQVHFRLLSTTINEPTGVISPNTIAVELIGRSSLPVVVNFDINPSSTATVGADYTLSPNTPIQITIPPLLTAGSLIFTPASEEPGLDEIDETVVIDITTVSNATPVPFTQHTITLMDTDNPPDIFFTQNAQTAPEGVTVQVTARLSAVSTKQVIVPVIYDPPPLSTAINPTDYVPNGLSPTTAIDLVIPPGSTDAIIEFTLVLDTTDEPPETVQLHMGTPNLDPAGNPTAILGTPSQHILTIATVAQPSVFYQVAIGDVTEASTQVAIQVLLTNAWTQNVTVAFAVDPSSTASSGTDFSLVTASPLVITPGRTSATIVVDILHDIFDESNETVVIPITAVTNATLGIPNTHVVNIIDNDGAPTVQFTVNSSSVSEDAGTATVEVQLSSPTSYIVTVPVLIGPSTAIEGPLDDYTYTPVGSLTIPVGATTASMQVAVNNDIGNDRRGEPNETVLFQLGNPTNATLGLFTSHVLTILENDLCPVNYYLVAAGAKVTVSFNYFDNDSPLTIGSARFDFQSSNVARRLSDVYQNNTLIFYSLAGALTGDYVEIPDAGAGYNWVSTPQLTAATVFEFVFKDVLPAGYPVSLSLNFNPGCDQVFTFVP